MVNTDNSDLDDILGRKSSSPNPLLRIVPDWFKDRYNLTILISTIIILFAHFVLIPYALGYVYDENFYVREAQSILSDTELVRLEHPNLGKLFIASGIVIFGDNEWGWRMLSVIFSAASILIFYAICRRLTGKLAALLATIFFMFESLNFMISGLGMLEVFTLTFMLLAFLLCLQDRYALSGVSLALAGLCKMTGFLGLFVILGYLLIKNRRQALRSIGVLLISTSIVFIVLLPITDFAATREWLNPITRVWDMLLYHQGLTYESHDIAGQSPPWEWLLEWQGIIVQNYPGIKLTMSIAMWPFIIPLICYMTYDYIKKRSNVSLFVLLWFTATYLIWIPIVIATDRITYLYYMYPTIGAISLAMGFAFSKLWAVKMNGRFLLSHPGINTAIRSIIHVAIVGLIALHILFFIYIWISPWASPS